MAVESVKTPSTRMAKARIRAKLKSVFCLFFIVFPPKRISNSLVGICILNYLWKIRPSLIFFRMGQASWSVNSLWNGAITGLMVTVRDRNMTWNRLNSKLGQERSTFYWTKKATQRGGKGMIPMWINDYEWSLWPVVSIALGNRRVKIVPPVGLSATDKCPWIRSTNCLVMARPRPVPGMEPRTSSLR